MSALWLKSSAVMTFILILIFRENCLVNKQYVKCFHVLDSVQVSLFKLVALSNAVNATNHWTTLTIIWHSAPVLWRVAVCLCWHRLNIKGLKCGDDADMEAKQTNVEMSLTFNDVCTWKNMSWWTCLNGKSITIPPAGAKANWQSVGNTGNVRCCMGKHSQRFGDYTVCYLINDTSFITQRKCNSLLL